MAPRFQSGCRWSISPHGLEGGGAGSHISLELLAEGGWELRVRRREEGYPAKSRFNWAGGKLL